MDEVIEKIYCMPYNGGGNDALATAALMQDKNSPAEMAALMGGMGNQWKTRCLISKRYSSRLFITTNEPARTNSTLCLRCYYTSFEWNT